MKHAFTLIELLIVIVIIGILAAMAIPKMIGLDMEAKKASCFGTAGAINTALYGYYMRMGMSGNSVFPRTLHSPVFITYLIDGTLPRHPIGRDWNTYYFTYNPLPEGPEAANFSIGKNTDYGVCTAF